MLLTLADQGRHRVDQRTHQPGYGKDMSAYAVEDYTVVKHVMAKPA